MRIHCIFVPRDVLFPASHHSIAHLTIPDTTKYFVEARYGKLVGMSRSYLKEAEDMGTKTPLRLFSLPLKGTARLILAFTYTTDCITTVYRNVESSAKLQRHVMAQRSRTKPCVTVSRGEETRQDLLPEHLDIILVLAHDM